MSTTELPGINAFFNSVSTISLMAGYYFIKKKSADKSKHKICMLAALVFSSIFLTGYLTYHYHHGSSIFPELGWIKTLYLTILIPHIILAAIMVPMILATFYFAFKQNWERHRKLAKFTFPIWLYVSITGVIIYLMVHRWFKV